MSDKLHETLDQACVDREELRMVLHAVIDVCDRPYGQRTSATDGFVVKVSDIHAAITRGLGGAS